MDAKEFDQLCNNAANWYIKEMTFLSRKLEKKVNNLADLAEKSDIPEHMSKASFVEMLKKIEKAAESSND